MTLLVALEGSDGIAVAADSRATYGDPRGVTAQNDTVTKLFKISDQTAILLAGAGEMGNQIVAEVIRVAQQRKKTTVSAVMEIYREMAEKLYRKDWFKDVPNPDDRPGISAIIAGYDPDKTGRIYMVDSSINFAPQLSSTGFMLSGIPQYALYILNRLYSRDTVAKDLMNLAAYSITETATQDGKVGGPVQGLLLYPEKAAEELDTKQIEKIIQENESRSERLKESFFEKVTK